MPESLPTEHASSGPLSEADREARIEELLLSGLDHYFSGRYEQAITVWTRVAFLERGHGRARAYIERARGALAEAQRESEELVHDGVEAYQAGDLPAARDLLTRAIDRGGANDTALLFLQRLGRLETAAGTARAAAASRTAPAHPSRRRPATARDQTALTIGVSVAVAAAILLTALPLSSWLAEMPIDAPAAAAAPVAAEPLPLVRSSELRLARARALFDSGRLRESLRLLDTIGIADPVRQDADRLKADVQRAVLATITPPR